jgi:hypothetical protein
MPARATAGIRKMPTVALLLAAGAVLGAGCAADPPPVYRLRLSHHAPPVHHQHAVTFVNGQRDLERAIERSPDAGSLSRRAARQG